MKTVDMVVIGAGPAGMAAAIRASQCGASVCVLDEQRLAGGQIYRDVASASDHRKAVLGDDYSKGQALVNAFEQSGANHIHGAVVWDVTKQGVVTFSAQGSASQISARTVIVATGALERPMPLPGWTLPGVLTAGAAQILMKSSGLLPENAILVGSGPLLYLLATQLIAANAPPVALVETSSRSQWPGALRYAVGAWRGRHLLIKGMSMLASIRRAHVPRYCGASNIRVLGEQQAQGIAFESGGTAVELEGSTVLLHQGVIPNTQITRCLDVDHRWDAQQRCFHPVLDGWGQTSCPNVYVAGDGARIDGAAAAEHAGYLAATGAVNKLGLIDDRKRDELAQDNLKALRSERAARPFLDALYSPPASVLAPTDDTIICRCEAVTAGDVRRYAQLGCTGPNQTKAFGRSGMGPCQGRGCATTVTEILAAEHGMTHEEVGSYRIRAPLKPVTLGEAASINEMTSDA
ncbi:MAG: NAD(P)/FAD-dependent oxidoreductase [Burkholderiaceae bacterium]